MKKANFNTLRDLPVPESWIENALAIPEAEEQKPAGVPFWRRPRVIAMAASLVLVCGLSLALFLTMGNKPPVAVKSGSKTSSTEIVWTTDANGETVATEVVIVPADGDRQDSTTPTAAPGQSGGNANTSPTTSGRTNPTAIPNPTESGDPAETSTEGSHRPTTAPAPTEEETEDNGIIPNGPNGWNYDKPTEEPPEDPTTAPTEGEWEPPWVTPTEPVWEDPTAPTVPKPTQSSYKATVNIFVSGFTITRISQDGNVVYCRIYDDDGNSYGDSDLYSDQHLAQMKSASYGRNLSYTPRDYGILPADGTYNFEFYTGSGKMIAKGSAKLSAS